MANNWDEIGARVVQVLATLGDGEHQPPLTQAVWFALCKARCESRGLEAPCMDVCGEAGFPEDGTHTPCGAIIRAVLGEIALRTVARALGTQKEGAAGHIKPPQTFEIIEEIAQERLRQMSAEGWTPEHDDEHDQGEIGEAAAAYILASSAGVNRTTLAEHIWPWDLVWWKPKDRRRDLIRAAALIVAEIERLDRCPPQAPIEEISNG